jgi:hypothetical protein
MAGTSHPARTGDRLAAAGAGRADTLLLGLAAATVVLIAVQFALAGLGAFTRIAAPANHAYGPHELLGLVIGVATWLILAAAMASRPARTQPWTLRLAVPLALLAIPGEPLLAEAGRHVPALGALHALTGLVICALTGALAVAAGRRRAADRYSAPARSGPVPAGAPAADRDAVPARSGPVPAGAPAADGDAVPARDAVPAGAPAADGDAAADRGPTPARGPAAGRGSARPGDPA